MYPSKSISYYIISLGCSKNQVDSEKINGALLNAGFIEQNTSENADIIIINTCGFIQPAKEESIEIIFNAIDTLREHHGVSDSFTRKLVVAGCLSKRYYKEIAKEIPEIDMMYGVLDDTFVATLCDTFNIEPGKDSTPQQQPLVEAESYAYIKITEGCSNNCSYCAIPLIRGPQISLPVNDILKDVNDLCDMGIKELNIVGQDITGYNYNGINIVSLVETIAAHENTHWIRLLYCHPDHITAELIELFRNSSKIVPYIDIPFQHVSQNIVRSMGRKGDYNTYLELVKELREKIQGITIRSTFMVGFPGESADDFNELLSFIQEAKLDRVGAFHYSPEEDTSAAAFSNQVAEDIKLERYNQLMQVQQEISRQRLQEKIGTLCEVLVEDRIDETTFIGRGKADAPEIDGVFYLTAQDLQINTFVTARVVDATEYDLFGEIV